MYRAATVTTNTSFLAIEQGEMPMEEIIAAIKLGQFELNADYEPALNTLTIRANQAGLKYLQIFIAELLESGKQGDHVHIDHFKGLEGNLNEIVISKSLG